MIPGIKVGPQTSSIADLEATKAPFCEVWFDIQRQAHYQHLFKHISRHQIQTGLHFWGVLSNSLWANIAHPQLAQQSAELMRKTIDIAAQHEFVYVNIHPGQRAMVELKLPDFDFKVLSDPIAQSDATACYLSYARQLFEYAKSKHVIFTIETVPARFLPNAHNVYELSSDAILRAAQSGMFVANDFAHTASQIISSNRKEVWDFLYAFSQKIAPATKLLHIGFVITPVNGTDIHDTLANPIIHTNRAIPNWNEIIKLLELYQNRQDVWVIVEPEKDHIGNYKLLQKLLDEAGIR